MSIEFMRQLTTLQVLCIDDNCVKSLMPLGALKSLVSLYASDNEITLVESAPVLDHLERLHLCANRISSMDGWASSYPSLIELCMCVRMAMSFCF